MSQVILLVGTRKGCFVLESDEDRRDWSARGPFCESWPVYHAVFDQDAGTIYAAAGSEWHGSAVWRSSDLGETWEHSSEGLNYADGGDLKLSKVSNMTAAHGRLLAGAEGVGLFESGDGGKTWSLLTTLDGEPGRGDWNDPDKQPPGHLGLSAIIPHPDERSRFWIIVQGYGLFETTDGGESWTPRNQGLRRDWPPPEDERIGFCVHKVVMSPTDHDRMYQQNHVGMHRSDDAGEVVDGDHEGAADGIRLRSRRASPRPRHLLRHPARPGPCPLHARGQGGRLAHERRRRELAAARPRAPSERRSPRRAA